MRGGYRTVPFAGGLYPLEIYIFVGEVTGIEPRIYHYLSEKHQIKRLLDGDFRESLYRSALRQEMIRVAPMTLLYCAVYNRTTEKYGNRGKERYVCTELGASVQNVYLQAQTLDLGACAIGAFQDVQVRRIFPLSMDEEPLLIMPVGYPR